MVKRYSVEDLSGCGIEEDSKGEWVKYENHQQVVKNLLGMINGLTDGQVKLMENLFFCRACMNQVELLDTDDR